LYEQKHRVIQQETRRAGNDLVAKNKRMLSLNYNEIRKQHMIEENEDREKRISEARERRQKQALEYLQRKEDIALRLERKQTNAEKKRQEMSALLDAQEMLIKWGFITCLVSRYDKWLTHLMQAKDLRDEKYKQRRLEHLVYTRMMPIVWVKRSRNWRGAWDVFKKHFIFYRLWIGIKRKKEAAQVIRSFLSDTNMSLQLVRQVHLFRKRVVEAQRMVKNWWDVRQARLQVSLLQYSIVEAKLSLGISLKGETESHEKGKDKKSRNRSRAKVRGNSPAPDEKKKNPTPVPDDHSPDKKKGVTFADDETPDDDRPIRVTSDIKEELVSEEIKRRKEEYIVEQAQYSVAIKQYEHKMQTLHWHLNARNIMLGGASGQRNTPTPTSNDTSPATPSDQIQDENGQIIKRPVEAYRKIILSETEMKQLVQAGYEKLRQIGRFNSREEHENRVAESIEKILIFCGDTARWRWEPLLTLNPDAKTHKRSHKSASSSPAPTKDDGKQDDSSKKQTKKTKPKTNR
jgi:hypothetical protein